MTRMAAPILICLAMAAGVPALALAQAQPMYGPSITADTAKKIAPAAIAEAKKNNWTMAIAIVDTHGELVYFERMDDVQQGSVDVALAKARSAARFKRPTKVFQDGLAAGRDTVLKHLRRPLEARRRSRLRDRHVDAPLLHLVHPFEVNELAVRVDDRNGHRPVVLFGLGDGGGGDLLGGLSSDRRSVHRLRLCKSEGRHTGRHCETHHQRGSHSRHGPHYMTPAC